MMLRTILQALLLLSLTSLAKGQGCAGDTCSGDQTCKEDGAGNAVCLDPGYRVGNCSLNVNNCHEYAECRESDDHKAYTCVCTGESIGDGFADGTGCHLPYKICQKTSECPQFAFCDMDALHCRCNDGYDGSGFECLDINECTENPGICGEHKICTNTLGSYECHCDGANNYVPFGDTCRLLCLSHNDCDWPRARCNEENTCECIAGYSGDGNTCVDINECSTGQATDCHENANCVNTDGSYTCVCKNGYTGDGKSCAPLPTRCGEVEGRRNNRYYTIDPDGEGPANAFTVRCYYIERGHWATAVVPKGSYPMAAPEIDQPLEIEYDPSPEDIKALIDNMGYCEQKFSFTCSPGFALFPGTTWVDGLGVEHSSWGSTKDNMCACGEVLRCPDKCYCDGTQDDESTVDKAHIVDKSMLPITTISFTQAQADKGRVEVDELICSPKPFHMPVDCHEAKFKYGILENSIQNIDIDGEGGMPPFLVWCDNEQYEHVGITEIPTENGAPFDVTTEEGVPVTYPLAGEKVKALIEGSIFCSQVVEFQCTNSRIGGADGATVSVTSDVRKLDFFPGGNGKADSCGCGATESCASDEVLCSCNIDDGQPHKDFGLLLDKSELPVTKVTAQIGDTRSSTYNISPLRCSQKQFGIEPNCEKYRAAGVSDSYTYYIDADGPGGEPPFPVDCVFVDNPPQGKTIVHHDKEGEQTIVDPTFPITYLMALPPQINALLNRSTFCTQEISVGCQSFTLPAGSVLWTGRGDGPEGTTHKLSDFLDTCGEGGANCQCESGDGLDTGVLIDKAILPINSLTTPANEGGTLTMNVGPLVCSEVFPTCKHIYDFIESGMAVEGEATVVSGMFTADPDGPGGVDPFEVECIFPETIVEVDRTKGKIGPDPDDRLEPHVKCFDIGYTTKTGYPVTSAQAAALVKSAESCEQELSLECTNAPASGMVNFTTCDGRTQTGWAGSYGEDSCACGLNGNCAGGVDAKCNCDTVDGKSRKDRGSIFMKDRLPICQICLKIDPPADGSGWPSPAPLLRFRLSKLTCDHKPNTYKSCQEARRGFSMSNRREEHMRPMVGNPPVPIGCVLFRDPPLGVLTVKPEKPEKPPTDDEPVDIKINYITFNINLVGEVMSNQKFCSQKVFIYCAQDQTTTLGGNFAWYGRDSSTPHYDWTPLPDDGEDVKNNCDDYPQYCGTCGNPKGFLIDGKDDLPMTRLVIAGSNIPVVIDNAECFDLMSHCQEIWDKDERAVGYFGRNRYVVDADKSGHLRPFRIYCEFDKYNDNAVTVVEVGGEWSSSYPTKTENTEPGDFSLGVEYDHADFDQINKLAEISNFCWQHVQYKCENHRLLVDPYQPSSYLKLYEDEKTGSFGTGADTNYKGCACHLLDTCSTAFYCNCDAPGAEDYDQGFITNKTALPVTGFHVAAFNTTDANADILLTDLRCSGNSAALPRDCEDARKIKSKNGVIYARSGEYLISPHPHTVEPFMVYCDFDMFPGTGITVIKPHFPKDRPLNPTEPNTTYEIPYRGVNNEQLSALIERSSYCYQGVKFDCFATKFLEGGSTYTAATNASRAYSQWGGGHERDNEHGLCSCGDDEACAGLDSAKGQRTRHCNCDLGDEEYRTDAGILDRRTALPVTQFTLGDITAASEVNLTLGDFICTRKKINLNECELGWNDCHPLATCEDMDSGYRCICPEGFQGKGVVLDSNQALANGRECIDDNECVASNPCPYSAECINTIGDFECKCKDGYRQTGKTECEDINECTTEGLNDCDENARCENQIGSYRCICNKGFRGDGKSCTPVGQCSCFGDPHCISFDHKWLHFMGDCHYTMATDGCNGRAPTFTVNVEMWKKDRDPLSFPFSWVKTVTVETDGYHIKLEQGPKIVVDGEVVYQYVDSYRLRVVQSNNRVQLKTMAGLEVTWDGVDRVSLTIPKDTRNMTCGLCGNYDGDPDDDWRVGPACPLDEGKITDNFEKFGNSWIVPEHCSADCTSPPPTDPDVCIHESKSRVEEECTKILDPAQSPFKECLEQKSQTDLDELMYSCQFDLCASSDPLNDKVCRVATTVAKDCSETDRVDIPENWREEVSSCEEIKCPNNQVYKACGPATPPTCLSLDESTQETGGLVDDSACVEGCFCPEGLLMDLHRCIKPLWCGCYYNHSYISTGERVILRDCSAEILCMGTNTTETKPVECPTGMECRVEEGKAGCYCAEGHRLDDGACVPDSCVGLNCTENMECVNGTCVCINGYHGDCGECVDINECETGANTCHGFGEKCTNLPGTYTCDCESGYVRQGDKCTDINECVVEPDACAENSRCVNTIGGYICECCSGYKRGFAGGCVEDTDASESDRAQCCFCNSPMCADHGKVCGTDGNTYESYRALEVSKCLNDLDDLTINYKGSCHSSCDSVICNQMYAECKKDEGGVPQCKCPTCDGETDEYSPVCGTNGVTYSSVCNLKRAACTSQTQERIRIESEGPCPGDGERKR